MAISFDPKTAIEDYKRTYISKLQEARDRLLHRMKFRFRRCGHDGCWRRGNSCFLFSAVVAEDYFCWEHCHTHGFCVGCGMFWGGIESFDFGHGFCEHCRDQINADERDFDDDYFNDDDSYYFEED